MVTPIAYPVGKTCSDVIYYFEVPFDVGLCYYTVAFMGGLIDEVFYVGIYDGVLSFQILLAGDVWGKKIQNVGFRLQ